MTLRAAVCCTLLTGVISCGPDRGPAPAVSTAVDPQWDPFLDSLQSRTLRYFLDATDPETGLTPDRFPSSSPSSIAAIGFALTCYPVAIERGIITREEGAVRTVHTLRTLAGFRQDAGQTAGYKGFYYHFLTIPAGEREWGCELSSIDTGLLTAGMLFGQTYFDGDTPLERDIRLLADSLYRRMDWTWFRNDRDALSLSWRPERGFSAHSWKGYNEAMILNILALGSPAHPVTPDLWDAWTSTYAWATYYGSEFISFGPLFGHQYSHCWIDFRGIRDSVMRGRGIDYFENSRRATYSQRSYAWNNPNEWRDYSDSIWGLTACDGPKDTAFSVDGDRRKFFGYSARGASIDWVNDDGTIAPTAAGGSVPFAPEICIPALMAMKQKYGDPLWTRHGFVDAFNPTYRTPSTPAGWFDPDYLSIDQGPIALMIENYRTGLVWNVMKRNPYIVTGLRRAGFTGGWLDATN